MPNKFKNVSVISTGSWVPSNLKNLSNSDGIYQVQINELVLMASIGIHDHEKIKKQRVSISLSIKAVDNLHKVNESIKNVVSYEMIIKKLKKMCSKGHIELLETLSEKIFDMCFEDSRILSVWMKLEKLDVFQDTKSVGIEIIRERNDYIGKKKESNSVAKLKKK